MKTLLFTALMALPNLAMGRSANDCILNIPRDCEVIGSYYAPASSDFHVVEVDCRKANGAIVKYMTKRMTLSAFFGMGRNYLPSRIDFVPWPHEDIRLDCQ